MNNKINVSVKGVWWHDWNEIMDLLEEMEEVVRKRVPSLISSSGLIWHLEMPEEKTVAISVRYVAGTLNVMASFEVRLFHEDIEAGTMIWLNGNRLRNDDYKGLIFEALIDELK